MRFFDLNKIQSLKFKTSTKSIIAKFNVNNREN